MHLQTYKPTQWNQFFQLAMDIKILDQNEMFNDANKILINNKFLNIWQ